MESLEKYPDIISINIESKENVFVILFDERYNTLMYDVVNNDKYVSECDKEQYFYIKEKFEEFKSKDIEYGRTEPFFYQPVKNINIKDFIDYLKIYNRENIINKLLNEEPKTTTQN